MLLHQLISAAMIFFVINEEFLVNNQSKPLAPLGVEISGIFGW